MKVFLYFILFTSIVFSKDDFFKRLKILEDKVSCQEQYNLHEKLKKSQEKYLQDYLICIDSRVQYIDDKIINQKSNGSPAPFLALLELLYKHIGIHKRKNVIQNDINKAFKTFKEFKAL